MIKRPVPPEAGETVCPACGAGIRTAPSSRRRRVQCPKCREVVFIGSPKARNPRRRPPMRRTPPAKSAAASNCSRRESRRSMAALRDSMAAGHAPASGASPRKLVWITSTPGRAPDFSDEQGPGALPQPRRAFALRQSRSAHPPATLPPACTPSGSNRSSNAPGGTVCGPEEIPPDTATGGLSLAVPELPVAKDAAATYLALKAAGFEAVPILDPAPEREAGKAVTALSLTLPPVQAA